MNLEIFLQKSCLDQWNQTSLLCSFKKGRHTAICVQEQSANIISCATIWRCTAIDGRWKSMSNGFDVHLAALDFHRTSIARSPTNRCITVLSHKKLFKRYIILISKNNDGR